jgi:thiol-disulfide isomerase/thioredoxin
LLPQNGTDNADSLIMSKLDLMPKSEEKDRLLKVQLLKNFELINNEKQRNELYLSKINQFSNPKYAEYIGSELKVINNQQKGTLLPKLELEDLEGKTLDLSKFKGKFVVIDFWATWCGPCRETSPMFEFQAKKFQRLGDIVFIAISVDAKKSDWQLFNKNKQSKVQQFWLKDKKIMPVLGINGIPRFMMVDKEGKMYNANMPRPNESNFSEIVNGASEFKFFSIDF